jgi:PAS domain-containing protein
VQKQVAFEEFLGLGISIATSFDEKTDPHWPAVRGRIVATGGPEVVAVPNENSLAVYGPVMDGQGAVVAFLKVATDRPILRVGNLTVALLVTMFMVFLFMGKAQQQLEDSERRFRAISEATDDAIIRIDDALRYDRFLWME